MKKYVIRSEALLQTIHDPYVYYQTQYKQKSVWCNQIEDAKHFDAYNEALNFGQKTYNIQGKWEVVEYNPNPSNPKHDAYDRAMRGI